MAIVKLGVVGCGFISGIHEKAFADLKGKMEVVGCCDLIVERAQKMAEMVGCDFVCTDYRELFGRVDAVLLALPHEEHYPIGSDFIRQGVHVMMEKLGGGGHRTVSGAQLADVTVEEAKERVKDAIRAMIEKGEC